MDETVKCPGGKMRRRIAGLLTEVKGCFGRASQAARRRLGEMSLAVRRSLGRFVRTHKVLAFMLTAVANVLIFLALCADDPVTVTLYFRKGEYSGMERRDWVIFILATIVSNLYWIIGWTIGIALLWTRVKRLFSS
jgi:hypothetical protein